MISIFGLTGMFGNQFLFIYGLAGPKIPTTEASVPRGPSRNRDSSAAPSATQRVASERVCAVQVLSMTQPIFAAVLAVVMKQQKLTGILELAASIDEMKSVDVAVKKTKATETLVSLLIHVPPGMKILRADFSKHAEMTVNQMKGIAHKYMKRTLKGKNKQQFADAFAAARDELGWKLREFVERACLDTGNGTRYYECTAGKFTTWALPEDGKVIPNVP